MSTFLHTNLLYNLRRKIKIKILLSKENFNLKNKRIYNDTCLSYLISQQGELLEISTNKKKKSIPRS